MRLPGKLRSNSDAIAALPLSARCRVPVPVKWVCRITGSPAGQGTHDSPFHANQRSRSWSNTNSGLLHSLANSAPQPVPPLTV